MEEDSGLEEFSPEDFQCDPIELRKLWRRRPIRVRQRDANDCGAACLAAVSKFYGLQINIRAFRDLLSVSREGVSLFVMREVAKKIGFQSEVWRTDYDGLLALRVPFILLTGAHFIVVYRV